jgi:hypothetical protein
MAILVIGSSLVAAAVALDFIFRFRMARIGHRWELLRGGAFDYREYHKVRPKRGWAAWPVYLMWAIFTCGIAMLIAWFLVHFGPHPTR